MKRKLALGLSILASLFIIGCSNNSIDVVIIQLRKGIPLITKKYHHLKIMKNHMKMVI